ncbi:MAG: phage minor head protein, partial [Clostridiales bacterium]
MNKRQKEVERQLLENEQEILSKLELNYTRALADIKKNIKSLMVDLTQSKVYQIEYQMMLEQQLSGALDVLHSTNFTSIAQYMQKCYEDGFMGSFYDIMGQGIPLVLPLNQEQLIKAVSKTGDDYKLSNKLGVSTKELKKQVQAEISRGFATEMSYQEIARNISNYGQASFNRAALIAQTEGHRIQNEAKMDAMGAAKGHGADIVKQWDSTMDGKTRKSHKELDGQIRELDEPFEIGGRSGMYPGGFGAPSEDCRCRCAVLQRARWALDEDELETLKERAAYFGLDKTNNFADFRVKYLKARVKDGIIKSEDNGMNVDILIDEFTPCLQDRLTGKIMQTEMSAYKPKTKEFENWNFDWTKPETFGFEVYALTLEGDSHVQGLIALKDESDNAAIHIDIVETAPHNFGSQGKYKGVGGHLFAFAGKKSIDAGYA